MKDHDHKHIIKKIIDVMKRPPLPEETAIELSLSKETVRTTLDPSSFPSSPEVTTTWHPPAFYHPAHYDSSERVH